MAAPLDVPMTGHADRSRAFDGGTISSACGSQQVAQHGRLAVKPHSSLCM